MIHAFRRRHLAAAQRTENVLDHLAATLSIQPERENHPIPVDRHGGRRIKQRVARS